VRGHGRQLGEPCHGRRRETITITVKEKATELKLAKGDVLGASSWKMRPAQASTLGKLPKSDSAVIKAKENPRSKDRAMTSRAVPSCKSSAFQAQAAGTSELELHYKRPFEKDTPPAKTYKLTIQVVDPK